MSPAFSTGLGTLSFVALALLLAATAFMDIRERRIPNSLTGPGLLAALVLESFLVRGLPVSALAGAFLALLVAFPIVVMGGIGAGDAKLLMAVGAFVGPGGLLSVVIYGGMAGGILAIGNALRRGVLLGVLINVKNLLLHWATLGRRGQKIDLNSPGAESIPYALAIAAGALLTWFFPFSVGGLF